MHLSGDRLAMLRNQVTVLVAHLPKRSTNWKGGLRTVISRAIWAAYQHDVDSAGENLATGTPSTITTMITGIRRLWNSGSKENKTPPTGGRRENPDTSPERA
jgi:hypothetical protein